MLPLAVATLAALSVTASPLAPRWLPGYDTSRLGPSNADCYRQEYYLEGIASNNTVFMTGEFVFLR